MSPGARRLAFVVRFLLNLNREEVEKVKQAVKDLSGSSTGGGAAGQTGSGTRACQ